MVPASHAQDARPPPQRGAAQRPRVGFRMPVPELVMSSVRRPVDVCVFFLWVRPSGQPPASSSGKERAIPSANPRRVCRHRLYASMIEQKNPRPFQRHRGASADSDPGVCQIADVVGAEILTAGSQCHCRRITAVSPRVLERAIACILLFRTLYPQVCRCHTQSARGANGRITSSGKRRPGLHRASAFRTLSWAEMLP